MISSSADMAAGKTTPGEAGGSVARSEWGRWWRLRAIWLALGVLLGVLALAAAVLLPLRPNPAAPAPAFSLGWWLEPGEINAFARLPVITGKLIHVAFGTDGKTALAVGEGGTVLRSADGGVSWGAVTSGTRANLKCVAFGADRTTTLAVGDGGVVLRSEDRGKSWGAVTSGTQANLRGVAFGADGKTALAVDYGGAVERTRDGGVSWGAVTSGTQPSLRGVALGADGKTALAVGEGGAVLRKITGALDRQLWG